MIVSGVSAHTRVSKVCAKACLHCVSIALQIPLPTKDRRNLSCHEKRKYFYVKCSWNHWKVVCVTLSFVGRLPHSSDVLYESFAVKTDQLRAFPTRQRYSVSSRSLQRYWATVPVQLVCLPSVLSSVWLILSVQTKASLSNNQYNGRVRTTKMLLVSTCQARLGMNGEANKLFIKLYDQDNYVNEQ